MIQHIVLVRFRPEVSANSKAAIFADLAGLKRRLPGMTGFVAGPNVSPEGLGKGYLDGFVCTFDSASARDGYLVDEEHQRIGARLVAAADGGTDGLIVFDIESD
jgi:hypothetical protein